MRTLSILLISLILLSVNIFADIHENAGNSSAQFLKIGPGGRIPGLGNAGTSIAGMAESLFYNPAGLVYLENIEINGNYSKWFEKMNYSSAAVGVPVKNIGTFGAGFIGLFYGDIPIVVQDSGGDLSNTGDNTSANDIAVYLSYGKKINNSLSAGVNMKLINQTLEEETATTISFDIGGMKKLLEEKLCIGLVIQNIGTKAKFMEKAYNLPLIIKSGVSYEIFELKKYEGLIAIDILKPMDDNFKINIGIEYAFNKMVYIRGGYQIGNDLSNLTIGGGLNMPIRNNYTKVDYAYVPYGSLGATHRIGLVFGFKKK